jgi:hypothetical protein
MQSLDFVIAGAQKCATSWLYYCLKDHPQIYLPSSKREQVYLGGRLHKKRGNVWFFNKIGVSDIEKVNGDVSVDYIFDPTSPAVISDLFPGTKLIISLREPIERAVSAYYWNLRCGNVEDMDLGKGMRRVIDKTSTAEDPDLSYDASSYYLNILARGLYDIQVKRYLNHFPQDQFLVLPFDRIKTEGGSILSYVYEFLGVDSSFRPSRLNRSRRPKRNSYLRFLLRFERDSPNTSLYRRIGNATHQLAGWLGFGRDRPSLPHNVEEELCRFYRPHVHELFELIQDLPYSRELWDDVSWSRIV